MPDYQGMVDLDAGDFVSATDMDRLRENIEWLAGLKRGGASLSTLVAGLHVTGVAQAAFGEYAGDGTGSSPGGGLAVTTADADGNNFEPDFLLISKKDNSASVNIYINGHYTYSTGAGITFTSTGFNASDGNTNTDPNNDTTTYTYLAMRF